MWKVWDVEPVKVLGADGYPYGFNIVICLHDAGRG
jgi:hypothetical protein